jgi:chromosome segregation ATPase
MRWPWTSLARLESERWHHEQRISELRAQMLARIEDADDEITWLREKNEHLTEQLVRIQRHQAGLHEVPKQPRPALEPMPVELREYVAGFANRSIQKAMRDAAYRRHSQGEPWASIMADAMADDQPEGAEG